MFLLRLLFVSSVIVGKTSSALADDMQLIKSADPIMHFYDGRTLDIDGLKLGMTVQEVNAALLVKYNMEPSEQKTGLGFTFKSINVASQTYISTLSASKANNKIIVQLGSPATGNIVVGINRTILYNNALTASTTSMYMDELRKKYGSETCKSKDFSSQKISMIWIFNANNQTKFQDNQCFFPVGYNFTPNEVEHYKQSIALGRYVLISAIIGIFPSDSDRVKSLTVTIDDEANKLQTTIEALKQLQAAASATYDKTAIPNQVPHL